jgi:hypothetical protein
LMLTEKQITAITAITIPLPTCLICILLIWV